MQVEALEVKVMNDQFSNPKFYSGFQREWGIEGYENNRIQKFSND